MTDAALHTLAARVAKRIGYASRAAYLRTVQRRAIVRDARRLGLLKQRKKTKRTDA